MPKLHELLAAEGGLKGQAAKVRGDLQVLFAKKEHHFVERKRVFRPNDEAGVEREEDVQSMQATVHHEIKAFLQPIWRQQLDVSLQVQIGCTEGKADIVLDDGTVLAKDVPVLALLELEKRATEMHQFAGAIPTLDPVKNFAIDPSRSHIYKAREVEKTRTEKIEDPIVVIQPTDKHPGQWTTRKWDKPIGTVVEYEWSGLITPKEKADMLSRTDQLLRAIKAARSRGNEVQVDTSRKIGDALLDYAFGA